MTPEPTAEDAAAFAEDLAAGATIAPARRWLVFVKVVLVLVGLGLLIRWASAGLDPAAGGTPLRVAPLAIMTGILLNQAALLAAALRLRATLAAFDVHIGRRESMAIHLRSLFYFFFVPMSVGYEISRFIDIRRHNPTVTATRLITALLLDRVLGLLAAIVAVVALAGVVIPPEVWHIAAPRTWLIGLLVVGLIAMTPLLHARLRQRVALLLGAAYTVSARLGVPVLLSLLALALVCASIYTVAAGTGLAASIWQISFTLSFSLFGMAIPLSLFGATLGEATGVGVMTLLGLPAPVVVLVVSLGYTGRLLGAIQGALLELRRSLHRQ